MRTIAILGAGFSGSLVAVHLLRRATGQTLRIVLIDREGAYGPGLAYGRGSESLLLNVVAGRMSALPDEPEDFLRWARAHDPSVRGEMFLPRRMYGRYITDLLARSQREAEPSVTLHRIHAEARDIRSDGAGVHVELGDAGTVDADEVVLAPGNFAPARPGWWPEDLERAGVCIADPWRGAGLDGIGADERVLIVGTGLTMMDVVLSLSERGHRGRIDAVSRRGLLAQAHRHGNPGLAKLPDPLFTGTFSNARPLLRAVRDAAERSEAMGGDWRDAVNALRSVTPRLWSSLPAREQARFLEHLAAFWNAHRHRAPQSVAEGIDNAVRQGRLHVHAGRVQGVSAAAHGAAVRFIARGGSWAGQGRTFEVDRIINCTGPATDPRRSANPLVERLLARGTIRPGPQDLGIDFDDTGRVVGADGAVSERVWLVGPSRIGRHWEATAVPELRVQAREVAARLVARAGVGGDVRVGRVGDGRVEPVAG